MKHKGNNQMATQHPSSPASPAACPPTSAEDLRAAFARAVAVEAGTMPATEQAARVAMLVQEFVGFMREESLSAGCHRAEFYEAVIAGLVVETAAPPVTTLQA